jgi:ArsR family transcriptional regulator
MNTVFRALSDPTRREILKQLGNGPMASGAIASHFDTSWATISRHLSILSAADLVIARRNGQQVIYELNTTVFQQLITHLMQLTDSNDRGNDA